MPSGRRRVGHLKLSAVNSFKIQPSVKGRRFMSSKILLFTYGLLQPRHTPPKSMSNSWPDRVRGKLFNLGTYPAATDLNQHAEWFEGFTLEIDAEELPILDEFEDIESGEFRRTVVTTGRGFTAYAYEYQRPLPPEAAAIKKWPTADE